MVARTKSKIACFAGPSFHDGNRPTDGANCADADRGPSAADIAGSIANVESKTRRLIPEGLSSGFTLASFTLRDDTLVAGQRIPQLFHGLVCMPHRLFCFSGFGVRTPQGAPAFSDHGLVFATSRCDRPSSCSSLAA